MSNENVYALIEQHQVKFVRLLFTNIQGKEQHITLHVDQVKNNDDFFVEGKMFDGSSIKGFKEINESDMALIPDAHSAVIDKFCEQTTLNLRCNVVEPSTMLGFDRDPRTIALRAQEYLKSTGIATDFNVGSENEFFIFDKVRFQNKMNGAFYEVDADEGVWNSAKEGINLGHRPLEKGGYFPVPPVDSSHDIRSVMCSTLEEMGLTIEAHHHEVATGGQNEIATLYKTLVRKADEVQILKYVLQNVAHAYGKTVTFMPKPLVGDNGSGMHCHLSLTKDGVNIFTGDHYAGLSENALFFIGGIIKHAKTLNAFTNATTNSYKRLVPGFEAPVLLAYSARNRSAAIRIPHVSNPKGRRIEVRFPDSACNPYLAFSALLLAGLDGIQNKMHPGDPMDKDLYDLPPEEIKDIPQVCTSLEMALESLIDDHQFLVKGGVFSEDFLQAYIKLKREEVARYNMATHPIEFEMYYSL